LSTMTIKSVMPTDKGHDFTGMQCRPSLALMSQSIMKSDNPRHKIKMNIDVCNVCPADV